MPFNDLFWDSEHPGGVNFAFTDGSVRFVEDDIGIDVIRNLATRNGEEIRDGLANPYVDRACLGAP